MRSSFTLALATIATQNVAAMQNFHLAQDWEVEFDAATCDLRIYKRVQGKSISRVTMFESDAHLLSTGYGTVDEVNVMIEGNIDNYPERKTRSERMDC